MNLAERHWDLIGVGNIGGRVAKKAVFGFDMKVIAFDPYAKELPDYIQRAESRKKYLRTQITFRSRYSGNSRRRKRCIGAKEFDLMKPTAYLINTSRGAVVDEEALIEALKAGKIAGAGLDVLAKEPLDPENPLLFMDNVLTAPHIGGATKEASSRSSLVCAEGIDDFLSGRRPKYPVPPMRAKLI